MARTFFVVVVAVGVSAGCGADTSTQERTHEPLRVEAAPVAPAEPATSSAVAVPENPIDRTIRRGLSSAIAGDADLKHREISFIVTNGDVNVTGTVRSEEERRKINDLAMNIDGVKSVANGLRVEE